MTATPVAASAARERWWAFICKCRWPLLIAGALLLGLTVIFPQIGLLEWVALIPAFLVILTRLPDPAVRLRNLYGMGFGFFWAFYIVNFYWLTCLYPLDFVGMDKASAIFVVLFGWLGLSAFQAAGAAVIFPLMGWLTRGKYLSKLTLAHPFLFAALWTIWEWFQAHSGWAGVPWARLPLGQAETLITVQSAAYFGSYFVTFLILSVCGTLAYLILHPHRRWVCLFVALGLFVGNMGLGGIRLLTRPDGSDTVKTAAVQGNISSHEDYALGSIGAAKKVYGSLTREAAAAGAKIIVWPETALLVSLDISESLRAFLGELAVECNAIILVGAFTDVPDSEDQLYNSMVAVLPDGTIHDVIYNKRNPVPFGEFVPYRDFIMTAIPPLGEISMLKEDIPAGEDSVVFDTDLGDIGSIICFDSIYEDNVLDSVRNGAEVICVSTNDSWFRDSRGVWMHRAQSQLRAIETGRYVVRAANTGVSCVISPSGEILDELGPYVTGNSMADVSLCSEVTLYTAMGNVFVYLCAAFVLGWVGLSVKELLDRKQ